MAYPNGAAPVWFRAGQRRDYELLDAWRIAPLTYTQEEDLNDRWTVDRYESILGWDETGVLFEKAAQLLLRNQFYQPEIMVNASDFARENRAVRKGDRVLQRIRVLSVENYPVLETLTMNEITQVIDGPRSAGFTYTTTAVHAEIGTWSPKVEWRENGEVVLIIEVISRARPGASDISRRLTRKLQLHAHRETIRSFQALLNGQPRPIAEKNGLSIPGWAVSTALLTIGALVFISAATRSRRGD